MAGAASAWDVSHGELHSQLRLGAGPQRTPLPVGSTHQTPAAQAQQGPQLLLRAGCHAFLLLHVTCRALLLHMVVVLLLMAGSHRRVLGTHHDIKGMRLGAVALKRIDHSWRGLELVTGSLQRYQ